MNAPSFLRRKQEPAMTELPRPSKPVDAETAQIMDSIVQTRRERDGLREDVASLETELRIANERIRMLIANLEECERKRDFYQYHSTSLIIRLRDIQQLIDTAAREAEIEAFKPRENSPAQRAEVTGDAQVVELATKLAPEGDADA